MRCEKQTCVLKPRVDQQPQKLLKLVRNGACRQSSGWIILQSLEVLLTFSVCALPSSSSFHRAKKCERSNIIQGSDPVVSKLKRCSLDPFSLCVFVTWELCCVQSLAPSNMGTCPGLSSSLTAIIFKIGRVLLRIGAQKPHNTTFRHLMWPSVNWKKSNWRTRMCARGISSSTWHRTGSATFHRCVISFSSTSVTWEKTILKCFR